MVVIRVKTHILIAEAVLGGFIVREPFMGGMFFATDEVEVLT